MHEKVLPAHSLAVLTSLEQDPAPEWRGWILAGGTGLAIQKGHRRSDDFDFFRTDRMDARRLHRALSKHGRYETLQEADDTLTILTRKTKLSFFCVRDPFLFKAQPYRFFKLADPRDIALMKLAAISGRGSRKDFVDLYTILRGPPDLAEYFKLLPRKYGESRINTYHILKSLTYFADAEREPPPRMLEPFNWKECKAFFVREAHRIALP
ncbi:MAG: nucleotidyl transferase AbiEii/AbiGii toxin family protein [Kiritimatiellae bacterium]|nr:nucleotidyl transferase AbiEii/AbiGii toxin family protein [Kiritimatiellia bacterium]